MIILYILLVLVAVILARTLMFTPKAQEQTEFEDITPDSERAVRNLAALVRCKTVSSYDPAGEDDAEIEKLEVERMNDAEKNFDALKQEIDLWAKVVESAPVLKYDSSSDIAAQIANTVQEYQTELQKRSENIPDDFPLKAFLARPDGT